MSTEFFNDQWRIPSNENQNKVSNYSMQFDGNNYVDCGTSLNSSLNGFSNSFSVSLWVKVTNTSVRRGIIGNYTQGSGIGFYIDILRVNDTTFTIKGGYHSSSSTFVFRSSSSQFTTNNWYNFSMTVDSGGSNNSVNMYVDGVLNNGTSQFSQPISYTNTNNLKIANIAFAGDEIIGDISDVSIFDYALSSSQVTTLYGGGTAITNPMSLSPKPVAYYQLGDQSVSTGSSADYLVPNNSLRDYVFALPRNGTVSTLNNFFNSTNFPDGFTASVWVKNWAITGAGANAPQNTFFNGANAANRFELYSSYSYDNSFRIWLNVNSSPLYSNSVNSLHWSDNTKWVNLVVTWDRPNGTLVLYSNGQAGTITTTAPTAWGASNTNTTIFGNISTNQAGDVLTSNYQMWNVALSSAEVETLYNYGSPLQTLANIPQNSNLNIWYKLNSSDVFNGTNWTIKDYAGSNDGTSFGITSANLIVSNLQHTSGFSPYALNLDGLTSSLSFTETDFLNASGQSTLSFWVKPGSFVSGLYSYLISGSLKTGIAYSQTANATFPTQGILYYFNQNTGEVITLDIVLSANEWNNIVVKFDGTNLTAYKNGVSGGTKTITSISELKLNTIGNLVGDTYRVNGDISNFSVWNTGLTQGEIIDVYNQGRPSNLNTFSGTKPTAWWQLGSNSSFNTDWTCLNEGSLTGLNAVSDNMTNDDIVNGVGYSANGLGDSSIEIKGDSPYSTSNGLSENMSVLARVKDTPPTV